MTEQTLERAIEIKKDIEWLRGRIEELKKVWAWGGENTAYFRIQAQQGGCSRDSVIIPENTAKATLDTETKAAEEKIEALLQELSALN